MKSESIKALAAALSKAQASIKGAAKDADNPFFHSKYADLSSVWDACRKPLTDNGLSVVQGPDYSNGAPVLVTRLMHDSGEWIASFYPLQPAKPNDPQALGSTITYARRYALAAMVGVAPEDDDGEKAQGRLKPQAQAQQKPESKAPVGAGGAEQPVGEADPALISDKQRRFLFVRAEKNRVGPVQFKDYLKDNFPYAVGDDGDAHSNLLLKKDMDAVILWIEAQGKLPQPA